MKKRALILFAIFLILVLPFVLAVGEECSDDPNCTTDEICVEDLCEAVDDTDNTDDPIDVINSDNDDKIEKAYDCLEAKITSKTCAGLSSEERIFVLLADNKCKAEVVADSNDNECWPKDSCNVKTTAQVVLAGEIRSINTEKAGDWLLTQKAIPTEVIWYLQIESKEATTCKINYADGEYPITIGTDRKINSGAGSCLALSEGAYWLRISPTCYEDEFTISCNKGFSTNLLFKKSGSETIHVTEDLSSASTDASTTEKVDSFCFAQGNACNYEASLWAALALEFADEDINSFLPYLITMAEENREFLPESFLYLITDYPEFRVDLLQNQKSNQFWDESGDKYYDTAVALLPFQYEEPVEKSNALDWLLEVQDNDGCWQGNVRNTAFLLYVLEGARGIDPDDTTDCIAEGYYCMSSIKCEGTRLSEFDCAPPSVCCDTRISLKTCDEQQGEFCNSNEICSGIESSASDTSTGESCCVGGTCRERIITNDPTCTSSIGECRLDCLDNENTDSTHTCDYGDTCCVKKDTPGISLWVWILALLIILVILGIVFRNKLRPTWMQFKSKFSKSGSQNSQQGFRRGPGFPPPSSSIPMMRQSPRRIFPPSEPRRQMRPPTHKPQTEMDDVLKKLKEMGN